MNLEAQIEQYKNAPRTKLRMLRYELAATRLLLPFVKVYKRGDFLKETANVMNHYIHETSNGEVKVVCDGLAWLHEHCEGDGEFESLFKEFRFYNIWKFRENALFVDNMRGEEFRSLGYFNYLLKQYCVLKDYIESKEEQLLMETLGNE